VTCLVAGLISSSWWGLGPVYASNIGLSVSQVSGFMTAGLIGGMLLQIPVGRLSDRLDRRLVILGVTIALGAPSLILVLGGLLPGWSLIGTVALFFGLSSTLYPLSVAYANDYLESGDIVAASGGFVLIYGVGAVIGPLASSYAMRLMGPQGMFVLIIAMAALLTLFILSRMRIRQWAAVVEKEPYVLSPETPMAVGDLDPRAEVDEGYDQGPDIVTPPDSETKEKSPFSFWLGRFADDMEDTSSNPQPPVSERSDDSDDVESSSSTDESDKRP